MNGEARTESRGSRASSGAFLWVEHAAYVVLATLLALTVLMALAGTASLLWHGLHDWTGTEVVFTIIDRLLVVLMLVEILHTVRVSFRSGALTAEPFLIVGLIASIRRVLVITLESSEAFHGTAMSPETAQVFRLAMIELGVLGGLILIMVGAIFMLRRTREGGTGEPTGG